MVKNSRINKQRVRASQALHIWDSSSTEDEAMDTDAGETQSNTSMKSGDNKQPDSPAPGTSSQDKMRMDTTPAARAASPAKAPETPEVPVKRAAPPRPQAQRKRPNQEDPSAAKTAPKRSRTSRVTEAAVAKVVKAAVKVGRVAKQKLKRGASDRLAKRMVRMRGTGSLNPPGSRVCRSCKAKERKAGFKFPSKVYNRLLKFYTREGGPSKSAKKKN